VTLDRWLSVAGLTLGVLGMILTVLVAVFAPELARLHKRRAEAASPTPEASLPSGQRQGGVYAPSGYVRQTQVHLGDNIYVTMPSGTATPSAPTDGPGATWSKRARHRVNRALERTLDDFGEWVGRQEPQTLFVAAALVFLAMGVLGVAFLRIELYIARVIASVSIAACGVTVLALAVALVRHRVGLRWRGVRLLTAGLGLAVAGSWLPQLFQEPWGTGGRFRDLVADLPPGASVTEQFKHLMLIYGSDLVVHQILVSIGVTVLAGSTLLLSPKLLLLAAELVLPGRPRQLRMGAPFGVRHAAGYIAVIIIGLLLSSGLAAAGWAKLQSAGDIAVPPSSSPSSAQGDLPDVGLATSPTGELAVEIRYCHRERLIRVDMLTEDAVWRSLYNAGGGERPSTVLTGMQGDLDRPVTLRVTTTRHYPQVFRFDRLPQPGTILTVSGTDVPPQEFAVSNCV
jgi:hypothetical protein